MTSTRRSPAYAQLYQAHSTSPYTEPSSESSYSLCTTIHKNGAAHHHHHHHATEAVPLLADVSPSRSMPAPASSSSVATATENYPLDAVSFWQTLRNILERISTSVSSVCASVARSTSDFPIFLIGCNLPWPDGIHHYILAATTTTMKS
jgi:hypothetical protein